MTAASVPPISAGNALELSHEANIAFVAATSALRELISHSLTDLSIVCGDPRAFAQRARDFATTAQIAFEAFVGAIAADHRRKGTIPITFPWGRGRRDGGQESEQLPVIASPRSAPASYETMLAPSKAAAFGPTVGAALGMSFDALARLVRADEGALLVLNRSSEGAGAEAQAVCVFGTQRSPASLRVSLDQGIVGAVLRTGIALNIQPEVPQPQNAQTLCFPVFRASDRSEPLGAIQLLRSRVPFDTRDEVLVEGYCHVAAQLVGGYGLRPHELMFDTYDVMKRSGVPFAGTYKALADDVQPTPRGRPKANVPRPPQQGQPTHSHRPPSPSRLVRELLSEVEGAGTSAEHVAKLSRLVAGQPPVQLVLRTTHQSHFVKPRTKPLHGAVGLSSHNVVDVAAYVNTIEECWRRSADDVQALTASQITRTNDNRAVRRQLRDLRDRNTRLESVSRQFRDRYEGLRRDLVAACDAPIEEGLDYGD